MTFSPAVLQATERDVDPISAFSHYLLDHIEDFARRTGPPVTTYSFGPLVVDMQIVGEAFRHRLTHAIAFAQVSAQASSKSAWRILAIDGTKSGIGAPPYRVKSQPLLERLHHCEKEQLTVRYNPATLTWSAFCGPRRLAVFWAADAEGLADWDDSAPCREFFHRMTVPTECFLAHAAGIGVGGKGIFLTGRSGSGKSTTTAAAARAGMVTTGDDFVLIDPRSSRAYALYDSLKLDSRSSEWFSELAADGVNAPREPTVKCLIHLSRSRPASFVLQLPISAIFLPRVEGSQKTIIGPASAAEAMRALVPSTICLNRGGEAETIRKSTSFLRNMPAYHCNLGSDPNEVVSTISEFVMGLSA